MGDFETQSAEARKNRPGPLESGFALLSLCASPFSGLWPASFLLFLSLSGQACTPQVRHADRLAGEPGFVWANPKRRLLDSQRLLERSKTAKKPEDLNDRALAYARLGSPGRARRIFYEILSRNPHYQPAYQNLLRLSALLEDDDGLKKGARRFVLQSGLSVSQLIQFAQTLEQKNRMSEARALYRALFRERGHTEAGLWLGADALARGNDEEAKNDYEAVLEKEPGQKEALFALGWLYYRLPHDKTALDYLEAAYKAGYRSVELAEMRARLYERIGKRKKALAILKKERSERLIRLRGFLLLKENPAMDLRFLLRGLSSGKKKELLLDWYGMASYGRYRLEILPEFLDLY